MLVLPVRRSIVGSCLLWGFRPRKRLMDSFICLPFLRSSPWIDPSGDAVLHGLVDANFVFDFLLVSGCVSVCVVMEVSMWLRFVGSVATVHFRLSSLRFWSLNFSVRLQLLCGGVLVFCRCLGLYAVGKSLPGPKSKFATAGRCDLLWQALCVGYLVDPASSHMLVSKTKPCMCKYKRLNRETANGSLNQL